MRVRDLGELPQHIQDQINEKLPKASPEPTKKNPRLPRAPSTAEETFKLQCYALPEGIPQPEREYRFTPARKWRFDFAWPEAKFAVEIEGVTAQGGRHQRIDGFQKDLEKYEHAMILGWNVYRVSQAMVKSGRALEVVEIMLKPSVLPCNN